MAFRKGQLLGDLPQDLDRERRSRPPVLNATARGQQPDAVPPNWHGQDLMSFRFQVQLNSLMVTPAKPNRCYLLLVNAGATEIRIGYGHGADLVTGLPLAANGGFHEPIMGTVSQVFAISSAAPVDLIVVEGFYSSDQYQGALGNLVAGIKALLGLGK